MYENQRPFVLDELASMASMLNQLIFKAVWGGLLGKRIAQHLD